MDGTAGTPTRYTGRAGLPRFSEVARTAVLRWATSGPTRRPGGDWLTTEERGRDCYTRLAAGACHCRGGDPSERSEATPVWLMEPGGAACGRLEDTRRAKRLIDDGGAEMRAAHLSCFAYRDLAAGADLLRRALKRAASLDFPHLFVAVRPEDVARFGLALAGADAVLAPATVYSAGLAPGTEWNLNTAEV
jgi:hypothetical protein